MNNLSQDDPDPFSKGEVSADESKLIELEKTLHGIKCKYLANLITQRLVSLKFATRSRLSAARSESMNYSSPR